jgi:2-amino-4-hydroxy-6-hydroxymethyldihydropteridine diphosphokinase
MTAPAKTDRTSEPAAAAAPATVFVGLGANLGDAHAALRAALQALSALAAGGAGARPFAASSFWRSAPVDAPGPDFVNAVARLDTALAPHAFLEALLAIERRFGRERPYRHAPRTLDLDLLLYGVAGAGGGLTLEDARLALPHPRAAQRAFVLEPLAELWPDGRIPGAGPLAVLLERVRADPAQRIARDDPPSSR